MTERGQYTQDQIDEIWKKAQIQANNNPEIFRKDYAGAWIRKEDFGNRDSQFGWEIDHLKPISKGGTHDSENLYPLHWKNNVTKGDNYPEWESIITSQGIENIEKKQKWYI